MLKNIALLFIGLFASLSTFAKSPYYYQIKVYHIKTAAQETVVDDYLQNAYLPALHRAGIPAAGVFKPIARDTAEQLVYVFIPFKKMDDFLNLAGKLDKDATYQEAGKTYLLYSIAGESGIAIAEILSPSSK